MVRIKTANLRKTDKVSQILVEKKYYDSAIALESARFVQTVLPWISLENFRNNTARDSDWMMLQYWLYYAEAIITLFDYDVPEDRLELATNVGYGIKALYAAGRRYNESNYKIMTMTQEECASIRLGLLIGDALKTITDERRLLIVGKHVQKVLSVPQK